MCPYTNVALKNHSYFGKVLKSHFLITTCVNERHASPEDKDIFEKGDIFRHINGGD